MKFEFGGDSSQVPRVVHANLSDEPVPKLERRLLLPADEPEPLPEPPPWRW